MGSVASILFATAWVRSDAVDGDRVLSWFDGATCAALLDAATRLRDSHVVPAAQCADVLYRDIVRDPIETIRNLYGRFGLVLSHDAEARMRAYLAAKPKDKHGAHDSGGLIVALQIRNECLIDLDLVEGEGLQIGQR